MRINPGTKGISQQTGFLSSGFRMALQEVQCCQHIPDLLLAASMTYDMGNTDKLYVFVQEARRNGIKVLPPSVNHSGVDFLPEDGAIRYSLAALKNIGSGAVQSIVDERERGGPFKSLADFAERFDSKVLNKRAVETLVAAGAFDSLEPRRARVYANIETLLAYAGRVADDRASGQCDLFGGGSAGGVIMLQLRNAHDAGEDEKKVKTP